MFDGAGGVGGQQAAAFDKPYYHISLRLLRVVSVLVEKYFSLQECVQQANKPTLS